jgi:quinol monooxygenase YgiN
MIILEIRTTVLPQKQMEFLQSYLTAIPRVRKQAGCIRCNLLRDMEDGNSFMLIGEWQTQEALDRHIGSDQFGILMAAADVLCEQKEVELNAVSHTGGMEAIRRSRHKDA